MFVTVYRRSTVEVEETKFQIGDTIRFISTEGDICEVIAVDHDDSVTKFVFLNFLSEMPTPDFFPICIKRYLVKMPFGYFRFPYRTEVCANNKDLNIEKCTWNTFGSIYGASFRNEYFDEEILLNEKEESLYQRWVARDFNDVYLVPVESCCQIKPVFYLKRG